MYGRSANLLLAMKAMQALLVADERKMTTSEKKSYPRPDITAIENMHSRTVAPRIARRCKGLSLLCRAMMDLRNHTWYNINAIVVLCR
jgi:hypothetical protein